MKLWLTRHDTPRIAPASAHGYAGADMKRTHLPLNALRVFDAAARHLSFTKAADELAVTPAAVGQQIRALEDVLGVVLFRRLTRNLELTPEAERALPALRAGFLSFEEAVRVMQEGQASNTLAIAAPRDFTAKWLAPRLARYAADRPDLRLVLHAADGSIDFTQANLDLAVVFGALPAEEDLSGIGLGAVTMVVVAAPSGAGDAAVRWPGDGWDVSGMREVQVADAGLAIDAAASGIGRARVPDMLVAADVAAGRVVRVGAEAPVDERYWLVSPAPQWRQAKVKALVAFLTSAA